jgi:alkanesulfonate monooxygenase SsuD/methylene tetrahydromethanopterin reductase-like flavin-dependent oxidoreductase (luciferase family)
VIPLLRRLWSGEVVHHNGPCYQLRDARLSPTPVQEPLEMWLGVRCQRRCGEPDVWATGDPPASSRPLKSRETQRRRRRRPPGAPRPRALRSHPHTAVPRR